MSLHVAITAEQLPNLLKGNEVQFLKTSNPDVWVVFSVDARHWMQQAMELPVPMILFCPECHRRHIDGPEVPSHKTHACQHCGFLWQPAVLRTVGVKFLPGCKDQLPVRVCGKDEIVEGVLK